MKENRSRAKFGKNNSKMPIEQVTPWEEIDRYTSESAERMTEAIIYVLRVAGEKVVSRARTTSEKGRDFTDQTGNLRSSIGYVIAVDGRIVSESGFDIVKSGGEGAKEGRTFAQELAQAVPQGICLVVVAGKNYAKYVAARGFDVLDSAELLAQQIVPQMLKDLGL